MFLWNQLLYSRKTIPKFTSFLTALKQSRIEMAVKYYSLGSIWFILLVCNSSKSTIVRSPSLEDTFKQCLVSYQPQSDFKRCFGIGAISRLQSLDVNPEFDFVDGLTFSRDVTQEYRDNSFSYADQNPSDLRSIVDTFDHVFSKRAMRWDMSFIYPGLNLRITPSISPGGILEFVMDPNREAINVHRIQEVGTGRLLAKQFLVPLLLGFKFNVASLLPIMFGILVLIAKKAVFVSKLALIVSTAFGLGSLLFNHGGTNNQYPPDHYYQGASHFHPTTFGGNYKGHNEDFLSHDHLQYRGMSDAAVDHLSLYGNLPETFGKKSTEDVQHKSGRNFAWSENEKEKNSDPS